MARKIKCVARYNEDKWEAICLDFDISVQGNSLSQVKASLDKSIEIYLESFDEKFNSIKELRKFVSRPVPVYIYVFTYLGLIFKLNNAIVYSSDVNLDDFCA